MANTDGIYNFTEPAILAHPALFEAKPFMENGKPKGEPKYGSSLVLNAQSADLKAAKAVAAKVAKAKWGDGVDLKSIKFPFKNGDALADKRKAKGKDDGEFQRGKVVLAARSKYQPRLSILDNGRIVECEDEAKIAQVKPKFFFGAEVLAQVNFVASEVNDQRYVTVYLNMVLATGKGTKLRSGGASAADVFKGYAGSVSAVDPTEEDEIPY